MDIREMERLVGEAVRDADLYPSEIPAIDLYLDQITSLVSEKRKDTSPLFKDRVLTKTMINNYSKDGLLSPIKGKKYSKEHILQMLLVYEMKNTLSIGEIKRILQNVYAIDGYDADLAERVYVRYLSIKEAQRQELLRVVDAFLEEHSLDPANEEDFFAILLGLSSMSSYLKNTVQILLSEHYLDLNAEKTREEQEKREEAKRQKAEQKAEAKRQKAEQKPEKEKKEKTKEKDVPAEDGGATGDGI